MTKTSMPIAEKAAAAPWWWSTVEPGLASQIDSLASASMPTRDSTTRRVWTTLGLMTDRSFPTDSLRLSFPEIDVSGVQPWKIRERYVEAIRHSPEADLARSALAHLGTAVRQGRLPPSPPGPSGEAKGDWRTVFSRSTRGPGVFFIRNTHRSHVGLDAFKKIGTHREFQAVRDICRRYDLVRRSFSTGSPANASTYEDYAAFLDGGHESRGGDYLLGLHGAWVHGHEALRFLCFELPLKLPPWPKDVGQAPTHEEIIKHLLLQLATDLGSLQRRVDEFEAR